jgi:hypothetical protein
MSKVTISQQTMVVLKNFATINSSILIREGNQLKTISVGENVVSQYTCSEEFPQTFGIYDLNQFLAGLSLFNNPVLDFDNQEYVTIRSGSRSAKYYFSNPEITLKAAPEKGIKFPGADLEFTIRQEDITTLQKASAVYDICDLKFQSVGGSVILSLVDKENETSNLFSLELPGDNTGEYEFFMKIENIRLFPGDYHVKISKHLITEWKHSAIDLLYYIALEP